MEAHKRAAHPNSIPSHPIPSHPIPSHTIPYLNAGVELEEGDHGQVGCVPDGGAAVALQNLVPLSAVDRAGDSLEREGEGEGEGKERSKRGRRNQSRQGVALNAHAAGDRIHAIADCRTATRKQRLSHLNKQQQSSSKIQACSGSPQRMRWSGKWTEPVKGTWGPAEHCRVSGRAWKGTERWLHRTALHCTALLATHRGILDADLVAHGDGLVAVEARVQPDGTRGEEGEGIYDRDEHRRCDRADMMMPRRRNMYTG